MKSDTLDFILLVVVLALLALGTFLPITWWGIAPISIIGIVWKVIEMKRYKSVRVEFLPPKKIVSRVTIRKPSKPEPSSTVYIPKDRKPEKDKKGKSDNSKPDKPKKVPRIPTFKG